MTSEHVASNTLSLCCQPHIMRETAFSTHGETDPVKWCTPRRNHSRNITSINLANNYVNIKEIQYQHTEICLCNHLAPYLLGIKTPSAGTDACAERAPLQAHYQLPSTPRNWCVGRTARRPHESAGSNESSKEVKRHVISCCGGLR